MELSPDILIPAITQLGIGGIFLYLFIKKDRQLEEITGKKDSQMKEKNDQVLRAFEANTETMSNVKNALENNTKATETLSQRIYDVIVKREDR